MTDEFLDPAAARIVYSCWRRHAASQRFGTLRTKTKQNHKKDRKQLHTVLPEPGFIYCYRPDKE